MSWFNNLQFFDRTTGLTESELLQLDNYLSLPLSRQEQEKLETFSQKIGSFDFNAWNIPLIRVPAEYRELLAHSNGGLLVNGEREFGFFGMKDLREYYLFYLFPEYMPGAFPIAFNGGGVFYAYDIREKQEMPPVVAVESGVLSWDDAAVLGHSLAEVFSKNTNIEQEL